MIDVALAIELIHPSAVWHGSVTSNTKEAYDLIEWRDERAKPSWDDLVKSAQESVEAME